MESNRIKRECSNENTSSTKSEVILPIYLILPIIRDSYSHSIKYPHQGAGYKWALSMAYINHQVFDLIKILNTHVEIDAAGFSLLVDRFDNNNFNEKVSLLSRNYIESIIFVYRNHIDWSDCGSLGNRIEVFLKGIKKNSGILSLINKDKFYKISAPALDIIPYFTNIGCKITDIDFLCLIDLDDVYLDQDIESWPLPYRECSEIINNNTNSADLKHVTFRLYDYGHGDLQEFFELTIDDIIEFYSTEYKNMESFSIHSPKYLYLSKLVMLTSMYPKLTKLDLNIIWKDDDEEKDIDILKSIKSLKQLTWFGTNIPYNNLELAEQLTDYLFTDSECPIQNIKLNEIDLSFYSLPPITRNIRTLELGFSGIFEERIVQKEIDGSPANKYDGDLFIQSLEKLNHLSLVYHNEDYYMLRKGKDFDQFISCIFKTSQTLSIRLECIFTQETVDILIDAIQSNPKINYYIYLIVYVQPQFRKELKKYDNQHYNRLVDVINTHPTTLNKLTYMI